MAVPWPLLWQHSIQPLAAARGSAWTGDGDLQLASAAAAHTGAAAERAATAAALRQPRRRAWRA